MAQVAVHGVFGCDSDPSDVSFDNESPTRRNTAARQKSSSNKLKSHPTAKNCSQSGGNLASASTKERPVRSTRLKASRSPYKMSTSSSSGELSPTPSPSPPFIASPSRKRKTRPSEVIDTTPSKRQKKQDKTLFD